MSRFSKNDVEQIRQRTDIVDVISGYIKLKRNGSNYVAICPFHNDKNPSFSVREDLQYYYCFGCQASGDVFSFLMNYENMDFSEAVEELADRVGYQLTGSSYTREDKDAPKKRNLLYDINREAGIYYFNYLRSPDGKQGWEYLQKRGISKDSAQNFGLGYAGMGSVGLYKYLKEKGFSDELMIESGLVKFDEKQGPRDTFFNRVMFPITDSRKKVIAFGGRVMGDGMPKYLNSSESMIFEKRKNLYGLFAAKRSRKRFFVLCEGYMDVISAHQAGFDNFIATLGTALTTEHAMVLKRFKVPIVLCYDSDNAGRTAARRGYEILKECGLSSKIMDLSPYKDPDEFVKALGPVELEKRIQSAENSFLVIAKWDYEALDSSNPDDMIGFSRDLAAKIATFEKEDERDFYIKAVSSRYGIEKDILYRNVVNIGNNRPVIEKGSDGKRNFIKVPPTSPLLNAQSSVLFFLLDGDFYQKTKGILKDEDFNTEDYAEIYRIIKDSHDSNKDIVPANILMEIDDEKLRAKISQTLFMGSMESSPKMKKNALINLKREIYKIQNASLPAEEPNLMQELLKDFTKIREKIENIDF